MGINLEKGQKAEITKGTGIKTIKVALGWDVQQNTGGHAIDLDAMAFLLNKDGKCTSADDFIFFHHLKHASGSVVHSGDNLTGAGEGDDEVITVELDKVPATVEKIAFVICIYEATKRGQNFGMVKNAFARVVNTADNSEIMKYDPTEDYSTATSLIVGEIYRKDNEWKFSAIGTGQKAEIGEVAKSYGLA